MNTEPNEPDTETPARDFCERMGLMQEMEGRQLPAELDQDVRDLVKIILEHGPDYAATEHGDMTTPLLRSLKRIVDAIPSDWRDIATAPTETAVTVYDESWGICSAVNEEGEWKACPYGLTLAPTHWQPLPEGPKAEAGRP